MKKAAYFRNEAAKKCLPLSAPLALIYFIYYLIASAVGIFTATVAGAVATLLVLGPITYSLAIIAAKIDKSEKIELSNLFDGFKNFGRAFVISLLEAVFVSLWTLLFIVPGIIKTYSYSMAYYIALENPEKSASDCIKASKELMKGHKWQLFCLELSYIGWLLLCVLTLGVLGLWVEPKMQQAKYEFYKEITKVTPAEIPAETTEETAVEAPAETTEETATEAPAENA